MDLYLPLYTFHQLALNNNLLLLVAGQQHTCVENEAAYILPYGF